MATINLVWDAVSGAKDGYRVWRADTIGGAYVDISGLVASTSYADTTAVALTHYFYRVTSEALGISSWVDDFVVEGWANAPAGKPLSVPIFS